MRMLKLLAYLFRIVASNLHSVFDALLGNVEMACPHTERVGIGYGHVIRQQGNRTIR